MFWLVPNMEAEPFDARGAKSLAAINLCSGYWQASLQPDSQPRFDFMTTDGSVMPTRTRQGGTNSAASFQEKSAECFEELKKNIKGWIHDYTLFTKDKDHHLRILRPSYLFEELGRGLSEAKELEKHPLIADFDSFKNNTLLKRILHF